MKRITVFCFMFFIICSCLFAKDDLLYHYDFENKTLFSFEGGMARLYCDESDLVYPGTYYLSKYKGDKIIDIKKVKVNKTYQNFVAKTENDFIHYVKYACENMLPSIQITRIGSIEDPMQYLTTYLNKTLYKYPILAVKSFSAKYQHINGTVVFNIYFDYYFDNKAQYDAYNSKMDLIIDNVLESAIKSDDPEKYIYDYILNRVNYESGTLSHTVQGALVDGKAVCDGYSKTLMMMLNMCGIQSDVMSGKTSSGVNHMWNRIYYKEFTNSDIVDHSEVESPYITYYCDITFEDTDNTKYKYYNLSYSPHKEIDFYGFYK